MNLIQILPPCITARQYCLLLVAFISGVLIAQLQGHLASWSSVRFAFCCVLLAFISQRTSIILIAQTALIALLGFGLTQWQAAHYLAARLPAALSGQSFDIRGEITSIPQTTQYGQRFLFRPEHGISELNWQAEQIQINVYGKNLPFKAGQRWDLHAKLKPVHGQINPSSFDLESWFLQKNITAIASAKHYQLAPAISPSYVHWQTWIQRARNAWLDQIDRQLGTHPYSGVIKALTIGEQNQISAEQWWRFSQTGVTHLVSISGLHVTMLAALVGLIVNFLWRRSAWFVTRLAAQKAALISGVLAASAYFVISGMAIPTQRTMIMLGIFTLCRWHPHQMPLSLVWLTALAIVIAFDPFAVLSIGFWLSFISVGILLWACANRLQAGPKWRQWLHSQWAASLGMLPLLLVIFGQYPLISPLANAIAIPIVSLLVTPLALLGLLDPSGICLRWAADLMLWCDLALRWLAALPLSTWQHPPPPIWMLPASLLGVLLLLLPQGFPARYLACLLLLPFLLFSPSKLPAGHFRAVVLDVGQGLSVLVQTRNHALLFDTGQAHNAERVLMPALRHFNAMQLDTLLLSHNDTDHIGGAERLLRHWPIRQIIHSLPQQHPLLAQAEQQRAQTACRTGLRWQWDQVDFQILWPTPDYPLNADNAQSCVLQISAGGHRMLITADIGKTEESELLTLGLVQLSDVLVVPHHGSKSSSSSAFVSAVNARYAVFSAGFMNRFGHPKAEIVDRYQAANAMSLLTSELGAVHFTFGTHIEMQAERQIHPHYWYTTQNQ